MKTKSLFAFLAAASLAVAFSACQKEEPKPEPQPEPTPLSAEAKLLKFDVTGVNENGKTITIEGAVFEKEKVVELSYLPEDLPALKAATKVEYKISEKATIAPDPTTLTDFSVENGVKFTVTAEDGKTAVEYTVLAKAAQFNVKVSQIWNKTYGELQIAAHPFYSSGIAFTGRNFATADGSVFDLDGKKIGKLNFTGVPTSDQDKFVLIDMTNDVNGVLLATVGLTADGGVPKRGDDIKTTKFYVWLDGWDKAPQLIRDQEYNFAQYISLAGDLRTKALLTYPAPQRGEDQMHHCILYTDMNWEKAAWKGPKTGLKSSDGCWGQQISFTEPDFNSTFFIWDSQGNNLGSAFYARKGVDGTNVPLFGTLWTDKIVAKEEHGGSNQYGNYSVGHARAFKYDGKDYVIASSAGWASSYLTIQSSDPNEDYLLRSVSFEAEESGPCSAYYYDVETGHGIVLYSAKSYFVTRYDIVKEIM